MCHTNFTYMHAYNGVCIPAAIIHTHTHARTHAHTRPSWYRYGWFCQSLTDDSSVPCTDIAPVRTDRNNVRTDRNKVRTGGTSVGNLTVVMWFANVLQQTEWGHHGQRRREFCRKYLFTSQMVDECGPWTLRIIAKNIGLDVNNTYKEAVSKGAGSLRDRIKLFIEYCWVYRYWMFLQRLQISATWTELCVCLGSDFWGVHD